MKKIILYSILAIIVLFHPLYVITTHQDRFFGRTYHTRYSELKKLYYSSQYAVKNTKVIIIDEVFEAFAGGAFLKGLNPILIVHDHPPLGRYIISFSILVFDNENTIIIPLFFASVLGLFLISKMAIKSTLFAVLPVAIFTNEPLMMGKIISTPLPEIVLFPFVIFSLYFFLRMVKSKNIYRWAILTSFMLGCVISIRFFVLGGSILFSELLFLAVLKKFKMILQFSATLPIALLVLFFSYTKTVLDSHSILKPFSVQKYILAYHSSKFVQMFTVWDLLLFNRWHTWWGDRRISSDPNWLVTWPISFLLMLVLLLLAALKKTKLSHVEALLIIWVFVYGATLSTGYSSVRYLFFMVPFLYIIAFSLLFRIKVVRKGVALLESNKKS